MLIAAILVNFSKLICALIVDAGQVFMLTFVNGYAATGGANIIAGLKLELRIGFYSEILTGTNASCGMLFFCHTRATPIKLNLKHNLTISRW